MAEAAGAWSSSWSFTLVAAGLIAAGGILGNRGEGTPSSQGIQMVALSALATFAESAALWAAGRQFMAERHSWIQPWTQSLRIFGEVFLLDLVMLFLFLFLLVAPLSGMGQPPQATALNALQTLVFLIPALYIGLRWSLAKASLILEAPGPLAALRGSWRASEGRVPFLLRAWALSGFPLLGLNILLRYPAPAHLNPVLDAALWFFHGLLVTWLAFAGTAFYISLRRPISQPSEAAS